MPTLIPCPVCCCTPCCGNCSPCSCSGGFDIDLTVTKSMLSCHPCCTGNISVPGSRAVLPCTGATDTSCPTTDSNASPVHIRVTNSTDHCIWVQYLLTISGLTDSDCTVVTNVCGADLSSGGRGNGVDLGWCFFCLSPGSSFSLCMVARIDGPCKCCHQTAAIGDFKYFICCQDNTVFPNLDCPAVNFCAPSPPNPVCGCAADLFGCAQCCDCCCVTPAGGSPHCCNGADQNILAMLYSCTFSGGPCPTFPCVIGSTPPSTITLACNNTFPNCINESFCTLHRDDTHIICLCLGGGLICASSGHGDYIGSGDSCPHTISCPG